MTAPNGGVKQAAQGLRDDVMEQRTRLIHVERTVNHLGEAMTSVEAKLDTVVQALTAITTRQELAKPFDIVRLAGVAVAAISIFTALVGGVTYVVNAVNAEYRVTMRKDLDFLQMRVDRGWGIGAGMEMRVRAQ